MAIDVSKGISHLEHLEDFLLIKGKEGAEQGLDTVNKFVSKIQDENEDVIVSEKIDGAPSLFFGKAPDGRFFVSTKSIFNKEQKVAYSLADIQRLWTGGIVAVLSFAFKNLKPAFKVPDTCGQGDVLFVSKAGKNLTEHEGQRYLTFQPNVIMYAVPVDNKSELYRNVKMANVGIVIHGAYETNFGVNRRVELDRLPDQKARDLAESLNKDRRVFAIDPFIDDMSVLKGSEAIMNEIKELSQSVESALDEVDPEFDDAWNEAEDPNIKKARALLPQFVNQQVRATGDEDTIINAKDEKEFLRRFKKKLNEYLNQLSTKEQAGLKTSAAKERKAQRYQDFKGWLGEMEQTFEPMLKAYFRLFSIKNLMIRMFDLVEKKLGKTFVVDRKNDYAIQAVKPEGYVLLNGPNMVKIVDRAEFSKNNLLYSPFNEADIRMTRGTTGDPESIGDKKKIHPPVPKSIRDAVVEDVLDSLDSVRRLYDGFNDEKIVEAADKFKKYNVVYVGRFQPPTVAHVDNIVDLSKLFRNVYVLLSDSKNKTPKYLEKNPLDAQDRKELLESDPKVRSLKNVHLEGGPTGMAFGVNSEDKEKELRDTFNIPEGETIVIAVGKEEDRFFNMRDRGEFFVLNSGGEPDENKKHGLYGIELKKSPGEAQKISASAARAAIAKGDVDTARQIMAGSQQAQDAVIEKMQGSEGGSREEVFSAEEEDYFKIEDFDVSKELLHDVEEDFGIGQEEAMDMLLDILQKRDE